MLRLRLSLALLLCCVGPAHASVLPPLCPPIGEARISVASLVDVINRSEGAHAKQCAVDSLERLGSSARPYLVTLLKHQDPQLRSLAAHSILSPFQKSLDYKDASIEQIDFPRSAIARYIEVAATSAMQYCGGGAGYMGDAGKAAVPRLIALLSNENGAVRRAASNCLGELGPQAAAAVPHLLARLLREGNPRDYPRQDMHDLARIGIHTPDDFKQLIRLLKKLDSSVDMQSIAPFSTLPPSIVPWLFADVDSATSRVRHWSGQRDRFKQFTDPYAWRPVALSNTRSTEAAGILIRHETYAHVPRIGAPAVPLLLLRLRQTTDLDEKVDIVQALGLIGTPAAKQAATGEMARILPALLADLGRHNPDYDPANVGWSSSNVKSVERFSMLGPLAWAARPALLAMLRNDTPEIRWKAAMVLGYVHAFDAEPQLISMRNASRAWWDDGVDEGYGRRGETRMLISTLDHLRKAPGYLDSLSMAGLTELAIDTKKSSNDWTLPAVTVLSRRGAAAVPALLMVAEVWAKRHAGHRYGVNDGSKHALAAIAEMGEEANAAFTGLVPLLNDPHLGRSLADDDFALSKMGIRTPEGMRLLFEQVVNNKNAEGRRHSATVLGDMGPTPDMIAPLRAALQRPELWTSDKPPAKLYFAVMGKPDPTRDLPVSEQRTDDCLDEPFPELDLPCSTLETELSLLSHKSGEVRKMTSDSLGAAGAKAKLALPHLTRLLRDESPLVRRAASENMVRIAGTSQGMPARLNYLLQALNAAQAEERHAVVAQLLQIERLPASGSPAIARALSNPAMSDFQEYLLRLLARIDNKAAANMLIAQLETADTQAGRDMASAALAASTAVTAPLLIERSKRSRDIDVQSAFAALLARYDDRTARRTFSEIETRLLAAVVADLFAPDTADTWNIDKRRTGARRLAAMIGFLAKARDLAARSLNDADAHIRTTLLAGMGEHGSRALLPLLAALDDRRPIGTISDAGRAMARIRARHPSPLARWQQCMKEASATREHRAAALHCDGVSASASERQ